MIGLLASEVNRLRSRRLAKAFVLLVLVGITVAGVGAAIHSHRATDEELAFAHQTYLRQLDRCERGKFFGTDVTGPDLEQQCLDAIHEESFVSVDQLQWNDVPAILQGSSVVVIILSWLVGASSIGAEWQAGTMATLLTWEPRRLRVFVSKAIVLALMVGVASIALVAAYAGALMLAAALRGSTVTDPGFTAALVGTMARVSALCAVASFFGASIAMITRSAAAGMGAGFVYLSIVEGLIRGYIPSLSRFLIGNNGTAWIVGHEVQLDANPIGMVHGGLVLLGYAGGLFALGYAAFRARDVT